ncbi:MAG: MATE family efflux transporter [Pseudomonadota bacterium]|nr:MATE family efflux transporter [Pseudomonadota bacterium]
MTSRTAPARFGWHVRETVRIGLPLAAAQLAQIAMGVTDTALLGTLGPEAVAAGGLAASIEMSTLVVLQGVLVALSALVAQASGAGRSHDIPRLYWTGLLLAIMLMVPAFVLFANTEALLLAFGEPPALAHATGQFLAYLEWCIPGAIIGTGVQRAFLPAVDNGWIIFPITLAGAVLNLVLCYGLIHGIAGLPALGFLGPAVATSIVLTATAVALTVFTHIGPPAHKVRWARPNWAPARAILRLGVPIAATYAVELTLFLAAAILIGLLGPDALAAQQVALMSISVAFMIPLGISQAANVRVGHAVGARDPAAVRRAGIAAILLGGGAEVAFAGLSLVVPSHIAGLFLAPGPAFVTAIALLRVAAMFQIADGVQTVAAGALRGLGDSRTPFLLAAFGYWAVGFPAAWFLTLHTGLGAAGAWWGLAFGLTTVATLLTARFLTRTRRLRL